MNEWIEIWDIQKFHRIVLSDRAYIPKKRTLMTVMIKEMMNKLNVIIRLLYDFLFRVFVFLFDFIIISEIFQVKQFYYYFIYYWR